jgi:hypothetical protein
MHQSQISLQHADCADGTSYDGSEKRFFRGTLESCRQASEFWKQLGARDAIHLGHGTHRERCKRLNDESSARMTFCAGI